ncbi:MAG: mechanosensitive ion channel protein MscS, partial [Hyphomonas sp.]
MASAFFKSLPNLTIALVILIVTLIAGRIVRAIVSTAMHRARVRDALVTLAQNLISIAAWIVGVAIAMTVIFPSVSPSDIIAGLGLTSVAIGFAFKDVFENFLAGVIILGREKLRIGDVIECEDVYGRVESILIRETHVRETDGELVIVPNSYLFKNPVNIETDRTLKRQELVVGVDYDTDMRKAKSVLQDALASCESVEQSETMDVQCVSFGGSSIDFKLLWWSGSRPADQRATYDEVAFAVKDALDEAGITIPFPQSTLSFREEAVPIPLKTRV